MVVPSLEAVNRSRQQTVALIIFLGTFARAYLPTSKDDSFGTFGIGYEYVMAYLEWFRALMEVLAWPLVALVAILVFKRPLAALIGRVATRNARE